VSDNWQEIAGLFVEYEEIQGPLDVVVSSGSWTVKEVRQSRSWTFSRRCLYDHKAAVS